MSAPQRRLSCLHSHFTSYTIHPSDIRSAAFGSTPLLDSFLSIIQQIPFHHPPTIELPREQLRGHIFDLLYSFNTTYKTQIPNPLSDSSVKFRMAQALALFSMAPFTRLMVSFSMYADCIQFLGTQKHEHLIQRVYDMQDYGCFAMTELGHGSNTAAMETTAEFDPTTREFVLNTPGPMGAKVWIGALGNTANMAVVFAKLVIEGRDEGLHAFVAKIRDDKHDWVRGAIIGDMGAKPGIDGVDNGFIIFQNLRIPYDGLLDRLSQVDSNGKLVSSVADAEKRRQISLNGVMSARSLVAVSSSSNMFKALAIAIKFGNQRRQFGGGLEERVLEYQIQSYKLMVQLAKVFALFQAAQLIADRYPKALELLKNEPDHPEAQEFHALLSIYKPLAGWYAIEGVQTAREACGGFGYSSFNMIDTLKHDVDVNITWDGENEVLSQQCSRYIIKQATSKRGTQSQFLDLINRNQQDVLGKRAQFESVAQLTQETLIEMLADRMNISLHNTMNMIQQNSEKLPNATYA